MINRTMPSCTIIPVLAYTDVSKTITWLCEVFGFRLRWQAGNHRAQLAYGDGVIAITGANTEESSTVQRYSLLVRVEDVMAHYQHAKSHGATIVATPEDFPYGERQYTAVDIDGYVWTFSQSITDLAPEDWGGKSGDVL